MANQVEVNEEQLTALLYILSKQLTISSTLITQYQNALDLASLTLMEEASIKRDKEAQEFILENGKQLLKTVCELLDNNAIQPEPPKFMLNDEKAL